MRPYIPYSLIASLLFFSSLLNAQVNEQDSLALVAFYNSTDGDNWTSNENWLIGPVEDWHGIALTSDRKRVRQIHLPINNLNGHLPNEIGDLSELKKLLIYHNENLSGSIPNAIGKLTKLEEFWGFYNSFTGILPDSIYYLSELKILNLAGRLGTGSTLSGELSEDIQLLTNLTELGLNRNNFSGELPAEIGQLTNLKILHLRGNDFTGELPKEIGNLSNLLSIEIDENNFSGALPSEMGNLSMLFHLQISSNKFSGIIPETLGNLGNLEDFIIGENDFVSPLPLSICTNLPLLRVCYIAGNNFSEEDCALVHCLLSRENIELGASPQKNNFSFSSCSIVNPDDSLALVALYNSTNGPGWNNKNNWLTGPLNSWYGIEVSGGIIKSIKLQENNLTGVLPAEIGGLSLLRELLLWNNELDGDIPNELGNCKMLASLNIANNEFTGDFPEFISQLAYLKELNISSNSFTGQLSSGMGNLLNLEYLDLSGNNLDGNLPNELNGLTRLSIVDLSDNNFSEIPTFNNNSHLMSLLIHNNSFTFGDIEKNINYVQTAYEYSPQAKIGESKTEKIKENDPLIYELITDGSENLYRWYRYGEPITEISSDNRLEIENFTEDNQGYYECHITNTIAPELTLVSNPIQFVINLPGAASGNVTINTMDVSYGKVYAYIDAGIGQFPLIDSTEIADGAYSFDNLIYGNYMFLAIVDTIYHDAQPTYYVSSLSWNNADTISISKNITKDLDIQIWEIESQQSEQSQSYISGTVSLEDNSVGMAEPYGITVMLIQQSGFATKNIPSRSISLSSNQIGEDINGEVMGLTFTNNLGEYSFRKIPFGHYIILVDIPGVVNHSQHDVLIASHIDSILNNNYEIINDQIFASGTSTINNPRLEEHINIFPNPTSDIINITGLSQPANIKIYNLQGQLLKSFQKVQNTIDLTNLDKGVYILNLYTHDKKIIRKIVKE